MSRVPSTEQLERVFNGNKERAYKFLTNMKVENYDKNSLKTLRRNISGLEFTEMKMYLKMHIQNRQRKLGITKESRRIEDLQQLLQRVTERQNIQEGLLKFNKYGHGNEKSILKNQVKAILRLVCFFVGFYLLIYSVFIPPTNMVMVDGIKKPVTDWFATIFRVLVAITCFFMTGKGLYYWKQ